MDSSPSCQLRLKRASARNEAVVVQADDIEARSVAQYLLDEGIDSGCVGSKQFLRAGAHVL